MLTDRLGRRRPASTSSRPAARDPECDADHGYTGMLASDDFSLRVSAAAEGPDAVAGLLALRRRRCPRAPASGAPTSDDAADRGFVEPAYGERSLADVVPAVAARARASTAASRPAAARSCPPAPSYVVFLVDGLGAELLRAPRRTWRRSCPRCSADRPPARPGCPSTTATSLTSLGTGLPPGAPRRWSASPRRIPGTDRLLNALVVGPGRRPGRVAAAPDRLRPARGARACTTTVVNKRDFRGSRADAWPAHRGAEFVGADRVGERIARGRRRPRGRRPSLTYVYDGDLDWTGHRYGVASTQWLQQLSMIDAEAEQLRETLPRVDPARWSSPTTAWSTRPTSRPHRRRRAPRAARRRVRCSAARPGSGTSTAGRGAVDDVVATWREVARATGPTVLTRDEAIARGWFGAVDPQRAPAARRRRGGLPRRRRGRVDARTSPTRRR